MHRKVIESEDCRFAVFVEKPMQRLFHLQDPPSLLQQTDRAEQCHPPLQGEVRFARAHLRVTARKECQVLGSWLTEEEQEEQHRSSQAYRAREKMPGSGSRKAPSTVGIREIARARSSSSAGGSRGGKRMSTSMTFGLPSAILFINCASRSRGHGQVPNLASALRPISMTIGESGPGSRGVHLSTLSNHSSRILLTSLSGSVTSTKFAKSRLNPPTISVALRVRAIGKSSQYRTVVD